MGKRETEGEHMREKDRATTNVRERDTNNHTYSETEQGIKPNDENVEGDE